MVRDRFLHAVRVAEDAAGTTSRDLANRARGILSERFPDGHRADDDAVIEARARSELGRVVAHPGAVTVIAEGGVVTLAGDVLDEEVHRLLARVRRIRGVHGVENRLAVHDSAEGVPALQGGTPRTGEEFELLQEHWTPAARLITGLAGGVLTVYGVRRRDSFGAAVGLAGLALLTRGTTNSELRRVVGAGGRRGTDILKTINIAAPLDEVFAYMTDWENFPHWMKHVREVRSSGPQGDVGERTHWKVDGPAGTTVTWDAVTTRFVPNELVAWKSVDGAPVRQAGRIRFTPNDRGGTRVQIQMSYNPPAGALGHAVATFFRRDPKRQMDDDLARLKTTIETGHEPRDAAEAEQPSFTGEPARATRARRATSRPSEPPSDEPELPA
jgi:uncharacterized membrane protein